ncbi:MAG TPA: response regulator transcription factor [Chitinophagales bacterium]|nr:response regulator transcription factor [Chitinophagales bacterium]
MAIRVCIFDDSKKIRDAIGIILKGTDGYEFSGAFMDCNNLIKDIEHADPDVVLMDIQMPGKSGIDAVKELKARFPHIYVLMLSTFDDDDKVFYSLCFGASGYLLKNSPPAKILEAINDVNSGGTPMSPSISKKVLELLRSGFQREQKPDHDYQLSEREKEVLECLTKGMSLKQVGAALNISYDTVRSHIKHIYEKLHVFSMTEAVAKAIHERLVSA